MNAQRLSMHVHQACGQIKLHLMVLGLPFLLGVLEVEKSIHITAHSLDISGVGFT